MINFKKEFLLALTVIFSVFVSACNDNDASDSGDGDHGELIEIDASDYDDYVYYNLETLEKVEVSDPQSSEAWHAGFRRASIIFNGGDSGPGATQAAIAAIQSDFYSGEDAVLSAFINADVNTELSVFEGVTSDEGLSYVSDENSGAISSDWYIYSGPPTHTVSANGDNWWIVRSSSGNSYAQFRVTDLTQNGFTIDDIDIELYIQGSGDSVFSGTPVTANLDLTSGAICYDLDTEDEADCSGVDWDLQFDPGLEIYLNSGVVGGGAGAAFGTLSDGDLTSFTSGATVPHWVVDEAVGIFSESPWYAYNLEGNHKLWPNYRVYAVDTGTVKLKAQIVTYYNTDGDSGFLTLRVEQL